MEKKRTLLIFVFSKNIIHTVKKIISVLMTFILIITFSIKIHYKTST